VGGSAYQARVSRSWQTAALRLTLSSWPGQSKKIALEKVQVSLLAVTRLVRPILVTNDGTPRTLSEILTSTAVSASGNETAGHLPQDSPGRRSHPRTVGIDV
jgi:hypothetical protein